MADTTAKPSRLTVQNCKQLLAEQQIWFKRGSVHPFVDATGCRARTASDF